MILLTNRCNCHCKYCDIPLRQPEELTTAQIFDLLNQLKKFGTHRIGFLGGEPLIRDDIVEIVSYAKKLGFFITMNTNAVLLKNPEKEKIIDFINVLSVSFDGKRENHDYLRGLGTHQAALDAIKKYSSKIKIFTSSVITKYNLDDIDYILDIAREYKAFSTFQVLQHPEEFVRHIRQTELFPENEEIKQAFIKLKKKSEQGFPVAISDKTLQTLIEWGDYKMTSIKNNEKCYAGKLFCSIDSNGMLYNCDLLIGKIKGEYVFDKNLKSAFLSLKENPCSKCVATCYNEYNNIYSLNPQVIIRWIKNIFY
ncbi:MAG TPA: radical SAM protein [bacterium]|nr:radical SAM protein [bacterium]